MLNGVSVARRTEVNPLCRNSSSSGPTEADRWPRLSYALPTETSEPEAPRMNRRRFEFNADLGDRVPLHVAHDQFHRAEARSVSNRGCPAEPARQKLGEGHSAVGGRCRIIEVCDR